MMAFSSAAIKCVICITASGNPVYVLNILLSWSSRKAAARQPFTEVDSQSEPNVGPGV